PPLALSLRRGIEHRRPDALTWPNEECARKVRIADSRLECLEQRVCCRRQSVLERGVQFVCLGEIAADQSCAPHFSSSCRRLSATAAGSVRNRMCSSFTVTPFHVRFIEPDRT